MLKSHFQNLIYVYTRKLNGGFLTIKFTHFLEDIHENKVEVFLP